VVLYTAAEAGVAAPIGDGIRPPDPPFLTGAEGALPIAMWDGSAPIVGDASGAIHYPADDARPPFQVGIGPLHALAVTSDRLILAASRSTPAVALISDSGVQRSVAVGPEPTEIAVSGDGRWAAVLCAGDETVVVIDVGNASATPARLAVPGAVDVAWRDDPAAIVVLSPTQVTVL
jgi:hypothetical protein